MKRILSAKLIPMRKTALFVSVAGLLAACGGGGGGGGGGNPNVRVDDPAGFRAEIEATGYFDRRAVVLLADGSGDLETESRGWLEDRNTRTVMERAAIDRIGGWPANAEVARAGERGGLPLYRMHGSLVVVGRGLAGRQVTVDVDYEEYGAWGDHSAFWVSSFEEPYDEFSTGPHQEYWSTSSGRFSESNPVDALGSVIWRGAMVGWTQPLLRPEEGRFLSGYSTLVYDFSSDTIDVRLTGIRDWNSQQSYPDLEWNDLDVWRGSFQDRNIRGSFYGPNHEEVGGVFDANFNHFYTDGIHEVRGAFGATREE